MKNSKALTYIQKYTMIAMLVLVMVVFSIATHGALLKPANLSNLVSQNAYVFVLATGMLLCILTGGNIDLSVGSVVCFVGAIGGVLLKAGWSMIPVALVMLVCGMIIGAWNAFWIAYIRVPPFITTLSSMLVFRGLSNVILQGMTIRIEDKFFLKVFGGGADCYIGHGQTAKIICIIVGLIAAAAFVLLTLMSRVNRQKKGFNVESIVAYIIKTAAIVFAVLFFTWKFSQYAGLPTVLIWLVIVIGVYSYITSKTTVGRHFYAVGGNEKAAKLSGINTRRVYFLAYTSMGLMAGLASLLVIARFAAASPQAGDGYELDAIGSCFIGGASAYGGIGTVPGVIVGALLIGVINMGMSILGVDINWQKVVKGLVLLAAVVFDVISKKNNS